VRRPGGTSTKTASSAILTFLPLATLIVGLTVYPITRVLTASLYQQGLYSQVAEFVGLRNFTAVLQSEAFLRSVRNTLVFTFGGLAIQMVVGLLIALLVHAKFPLRAPVRGAMLFSYLVPYVVAALTWRFMMSDATGILNYLIRTSGLGSRRRGSARPTTRCSG
jgi:multiple sugar transport system permease protein